jgi:hypothetical protein
MAEHLAELLLDRLSVVVQLMTELHAQLLYLLLQQQERLILFSFVDDRPHTVQQQPTEKKKTQDRGKKPGKRA